MESTVTVTEAARNFSDLINRVVYRGECALLTRNGKSVARIVPEPSPRITGRETAKIWANRLRMSVNEAEAFANDLSCRDSPIRQSDAEGFLGRLNVVLDTSVLIADERGQWDGVRFMEEVVEEGSLAIGVISASVFLQGVLRAEPGKRRGRRQAMFEFLINTIEVLPFGLEQAITHAQLNTDLSRAGIVVGPHDLMITATCLHYDWDLATFNTEEFARIPGLRLAPVEDFRFVES